MSNSFYAKGIEGILDGTIDLTAGTIKVLLVDTSLYSVNKTTHDFLDDVAAGARIGTMVALASKTYTLGVFDAADVSFTGLVAPPTCEAVILLNDTGTAATSRLIAYLDTATSGLPTPALVTQVDIAWNASGIFSIPTT